MNALGDLTPVFELRDVTKEYRSDGQATCAVRGVTLQGYRGQLILLLGPSGSGKTTLLTLAAGLIRPTCGETVLFGRNVDLYSTMELQKLRADRIGFVFQNFLLIDPLTIEENVEMVLSFGDCEKNDKTREVLRLLKLFGVEHLARKFPPNLSQGEKQRVAVARAIANDPDLIIADEPTGSLETKQGSQIIQFLHKLAREEMRCVAVASHDLRLVEYADVVIQLQDGEILSGDGRENRR